MKAISFLLFIVYCSYTTDDSEKLLKKMYTHYAGKWMHSFTFSQTTENYRNDSLVKTSTWYENIVYPEKFRIDFGDKKDGNAAIFAGNFIYDFRKGKLIRTSINDNDLTFLLGGMYFYSFDSVKAKLTRFGYEISFLKQK